MGNSSDISTIARSFDQAFRARILEGISLNRSEN